MIHNKHILAADDGTTLLQADEIGPLLGEAQRLVKDGDYAHTDLAIFTVSHTFKLPRNPELQLVYQNWNDVVKGRRKR